MLNGSIPITMSKKAVPGVEIFVGCHDADKQGQLPAQVRLSFITYCPQPLVPGKESFTTGPRTSESL